MNNLYSTRADFVSAYIEQPENKTMDTSFAQLKTSGHFLIFHVSSLTRKSIFFYMVIKERVRRSRVQWEEDGTKNERIRHLVD